MTRRGGLPFVAAGVLVAAISVAMAVAALPRARKIPQNVPARVTVPASTSAAASGAQTPVPHAPKPRTPAPAAPPSRTGRSPLEHSPGYFPPADPESASVRLGRREAPEVADLFQGGAASMEGFGRAVVAALNARDEAALHALRVTQGEFETILWREFPESRPITNITADDAWSMSEPRSRAGANRAMGIHGGRRLRFQTIEAARVQPFTNFLLHRDVVIVAVDEATGEVHRMTLAPSVAERKGRFKALLYHD